MTARRAAGALSVARLGPGGPPGPPGRGRRRRWRATVTEIDKLEGNLPQLASSCHIFFKFKFAWST